MTNDELRKLAMAANIGEWYDTNSVYQAIRERLHVMTEDAARDASYIAAANPTTVLALLDRVEKLEKALRYYADTFFAKDRKKGAVNCLNMIVQDV
jgi:hypothetical protein